ncbi:NFACT RNA binding domain-containing protein [Apilactobacillus xinyiensis]|uniref:NFACT RNA binding domain-containing protein n=1 Tax=Apilactobacillus xinyiensis TaxID=2841032 RepID=UPI0033652970
MSFDGFFTHAMVNELNAKLATGRVSKINQPYENEIIITIRANGSNYPLLLSANPSYARVQITNIPYSNPEKPTNFNMTLRKYLNGAILNQFSQLDNDRVLSLHFITRNELGDLQEIVLITEIMARHSNIILINGHDRTVIDAIKRIGSDKNRYRTLLPGDNYINPPKQDTINLFEDDSLELISELDKRFPNAEVLAQNLQQHFQGLSYNTSLYLANTLHENGEVKDKINSFINVYKNPSPTITEQNNKIDFTVYPFQFNNNVKQFDTLSEMLDYYYRDKAQRERTKEQGNLLIKIAKNELKKGKRKAKKLQKTLDETKNADEYRIKGEILMTYLGKVQRGMKSITLPNFYDNQNDIEIKLSNKISPSENAQKYFKRYQKDKNAVSYVNNQIKINNAHIEYFDNILSQIELANPEDLKDIKLEFKQEGLLKNHNYHNNAKHKKVKISKPESFISDNGIEIQVGKNNLQNDKLTLKSSDKREIWLHVQKIHGSHVIIKAFNPDDETLVQAAALAAYFSKARDSANVPVDYVQVKHVRKPKGAKPGMVIYDSQNTLYVTPTEDLVEKLRQNYKKSKPF